MQQNGKAKDFLLSLRERGNIRERTFFLFLRNTFFHYLLFIYIFKITFITMTQLQLLSIIPLFAIDNLSTVYLRYYFAITLLNIFSYAYVFLKFYKVLCYSRLTVEWLPMMNPYSWPFSVFHILTAPYFKFWSFMLPAIKLEKSSLEISSIIALEALSASLFLCVRCVNYLVIILEQAEETLSMVPLS